MDFMEYEELEVSAEELAIEEEEQPQMLSHAAMWDHFLNYVEAAERPWAVPEKDTVIFGDTAICYGAVRSG
eukprot:988254-Pleurochrysis_carterae.AAC.1